MTETKIESQKVLRLALEDGKHVLKNTVDGVEITISFAEEEPARNAKEACLSIITNQYQNRTVSAS